MKIPKESRWEATGQALGEGGQAQVVLVTDKTKEFDGVWAIKILKRRQSPQAYERFSREILAIKKLQHPNIIQIVDHSIPDAEFQFYVMEHVEGAKTLEKIMVSENSPFLGDALRSLDLYEQICSALIECGHSNPKIVHRDLSPANILIKLDGSIKIIDFGLCQIEGHETITLLDEGVGSVNYMAPECESGANEIVSAGADLYSAGKILWSAITGKKAFSREKPVFSGKTMTEIFPENPETWHLHHIFEKTIRHNVGNRWSSAKAAVGHARRVRYLIQAGYPSLEEISRRCTVCGVGDLESFQGGHVVFGNPNPRGIDAVQCSYCGVCSAINFAKRKEIFAERLTLE
jgi:serine/threonine protein kinase